MVEEGQLIAKIDDRDAVKAKEVAEYEYKAAKKQAENEISVEAAIASEQVLPSRAGYGPGSQS